MRSPGCVQAYSISLCLQLLKLILLPNKKHVYSACIAVGTTLAGSSLRLAMLLLSQ